VILRAIFILIILPALIILASIVIFFLAGRMGKGDSTEAERL
jgi:hypothetical protein